MILMWMLTLMLMTQVDVVADLLDVDVVTKKLHSVFSSKSFFGNEIVVISVCSHHGGFPTGINK